VIGFGASSIQTVPNMQPHVKRMDVFVRTASGSFKLRMVLALIGSIPKKNVTLSAMTPRFWSHILEISRVG
jgi:cation diffusion facilitator CzcD-associated flavoprotein CzcO